MKQTPLLIGIGIIITLLFAPFVLTASAHVPFGVYAGTHAVAFVPTPGSPLLGEKVEMAFFLRDLHGNFPTELFDVEVVVQEILPDGSERNIATLEPRKESPGIYTTEYNFPGAGQYRIEFSFNKSDEPDLVREALFAIEVRNVRSSGLSYLLVGIISLIVAAGSFWVGKMSVQKDKEDADISD